MDETIPLSDCKPGHVYRLRSRNLLFGVFNESSGGFIGIREKFGRRFLFTEYHYDKGMPYGTVSPQEDLGPLPEGIEVRESEPTIDPETGHLLEFRPDPQLPGRGKWHYSDTGSLFEGRAHHPPNTALFEFLEQIEKREEWWRWYDERPE
jgi:hypothetical protein